MKPLRRLILPALAAAPAAEVATGLAVAGPGGFARFTFALDGGGDLGAAAVRLTFNADRLADRPERMA